MYKYYPFNFFKNLSIALVIHTRIYYEYIHLCNLNFLFSYLVQLVQKLFTSKLVIFRPLFYSLL